jgi:uncharacterized membrane protein YqjE
METTTASVTAPGLIGGITGLAKHVFGLLLSRLELAALELSELRNHVLELLAVFVLAAICCLFGLAYVTLTIVALTWAALGWKILAIMGGVFIVATLVLVMKGKAMLRQGRLAFPETMNELKNDRDMLL